jgi:hypothetical protein
MLFESFAAAAFAVHVAVARGGGAEGDAEDGECRPAKPRRFISSPSLNEASLPGAA